MDTLHVTVVDVGQLTANVEVAEEMTSTVVDVTPVLTAVVETA